VAPVIDKVRATEIRVERFGGTSVIHIIGELDALTGPELQEVALRIIGENAPNCIIDLTEASFIDSIGVGSLIRAYRAASERDGSIYLAGAHGMIAQLIQVTQLHRLFQVLPTLKDALMASESTAG
jgi:anti-sigma B factor antagonist